MEMELRFNDAKIETNEDGLVVKGYVNETGKRSHMLGREKRFTEIIKPGVWERALNRAKEVHFLAEHDKNKILASTRNGSLELREDEKGLYMEAKISPTSWGKDYYQLIKDGILDSMSFGFRAASDQWRNLGDHFERTINELELFEVSVVRDPAYAHSSISARGIDLVEDEVPASELNLRSIEIRSDEDIEAIAKKIFEMLKAQTLVAEQHEDEAKKEEEPKEEPKVEDKVAGEDEPKEEEVPSASEVEPEPADKVEDEGKEEDKVDPEPEPEPEPKVEEKSEAEKLREFINQKRQ